MTRWSIASRASRNAASELVGPFRVACADQPVRNHFHYRLVILVEDGEMALEDAHFGARGAAAFLCAGADNRMAGGCRRKRGTSC